MTKEKDSELSEVSNDLSSIEAFEVIVKSALSTVPFFGSALIECINASERIQQRRLNSFFLDYLNDLAEKNEDKISIDYLNSSDFFDLTRNIFSYVVKTKEVMKHKALAIIYIEGVVKKVDVDNSAEIIFASFISEMSKLQILILLFVERNQKDLIKIETYEKFYELFVKFSNFKNVDKYEFKYLAGDLERKAILSFEHGLDDYNSKGDFIVDSGFVPSSVIITSFGKRFIKYIEFIRFDEFIS